MDAGGLPFPNANSAHLNQQLQQVCDKNKKQKYKYFISSKDAFSRHKLEYVQTVYSSKIPFFLNYPTFYAANGFDF